MQEPLGSYRDLTAWQKVMDLMVAVYELSKNFPPDERWGLTAQIRRASLSVPSNIAEGYGRDHRGEYIHHLSMANGSLKEAETQLIAAGRLGYVTREQSATVWSLMQEVGKLLMRLIESLK